MSPTCSCLALRHRVLSLALPVWRVGRVRQHVSMVLGQAVASSHLPRLLILGHSWQISASGSHSTLLPVCKVSPSMVGSSHLSFRSGSSACSHFCCLLRILELAVLQELMWRRKDLLVSSCWSWPGMNAVVWLDACWRPFLAASSWRKSYPGSFPFSLPFLLWE